MWGKKNPHTLLVGMEISTTTMETVWRFLKKMKNYLTGRLLVPYDPAISLLGIYPKECESGYKKAPAHPCLLKHYSQQLSYGNSQDAPLLMNGLR
jgi:hypothetical protein